MTAKTIVVFEDVVLETDETRDSQNTTDVAEDGPKANSLRLADRYENIENAVATDEARFADVGETAADVFST